MDWWKGIAPDPQSNSAAGRRGGKANPTIGFDARVNRRFFEAMPRPSALRFRIRSGLAWMEVFLGAWTGLVLLFLYLPIAVLVAYSFNASRLNILWTGFTFHWYGELWRNGPILRALDNSLIVAAGATAISVILGTAGAWLMHRYRYRFSGAIQSLLCAPMIMPEIVMGISLLVFFAFVGLELGFVTVIVAHVTFCFPFVLVAVQARLNGLDPALEEAALDLGASPLQAFRLVIVPCLRPAILAGGLHPFNG
jgi:spermidine/putrescine transport system permease protein